MSTTQTRFLVQRGARGGCWYVLDARAGELVHDRGNPEVVYRAPDEDAAWAKAAELWELAAAPVPAALTRPQQNLLNAVRVFGVKRYNGRAGKTIEKLAALNLVAFTYELVPHGDGKYTGLYTVTPVTPS